MDGDVLSRNLGDVVSDLDARRNNGELTESERAAHLQEYLDRVLEGASVEAVPTRWAWQYGDAFRLRGDWDAAGELYQRSLESADTEDRRVNDSLRLARVRAHQGKHEEALRLVRATFDAPDEDKGPILMAVAYEIVPEGRASGPKLEYARLLAEAVGQHQATVVAAATPSGRAFLEARPAHVRRAYMIAAELAMAAGDRAAARAYVESAEQAAAKTAKL
jgi:tetratricopeptide (TPR) repeat protein